MSKKSKKNAKKAKLALAAAASAVATSPPTSAAVPLPAPAPPPPEPPSAAPVQQVTPTAVAEPGAAVATESLIAQLRNGELAVRLEAARQLGVCGDPSARQALVAALRDPTAEVAREAALALGTSKDAGAAEALMTVFANPDGYFHTIVRVAAAEALGQLGQTSAVGTLIQGIHDPFSEPSQAAIRALGKLADPQAIEPLREVVRNANGFFLPLVQQAAVEALGSFPATSARD